jgi:anti-sigma regulatory factor (Ser/Thr protein kinase)
VEVLLEFFSHIICHLTYTMKGSISDLRIGVLEVLHNDGDHGSNLLDVIEIFSNLRESHESRILVSPI